MPDTERPVAESAALPERVYQRELDPLQRELVKLQEWVRHEGIKMCVLFEGRDAAGKGGTIKRIVERTNPRVVRVVALDKPTERERTQWYFQRYVEHLPTGGEIVLFDRSWYNRAGVEHVMGFCTQDEYEEFLRSCPEFERMLIRSGLVLVKYWFSVSDAEQERRFQARIKDPEKRWKLSPMDLESRARWADYSRAKDTMFQYTDTKWAPWFVVDANDKRRARLNCIRHLLSVVPYQDVTSKPLKLHDASPTTTSARPSRTRRSSPTCIEHATNRQQRSPLRATSRNNRKKVRSGDEDHPSRIGHRRGARLRCGPRSPDRGPTRRMVVDEAANDEADRRRAHRVHLCERLQSSHGDH